MRLLILEDDPKLGPLLASVLGDNGYHPTLVASASAALALRSEEFEMAVIDRMLPDGDGLSVCVGLRRNGFEGAILMLTARAELKDRVHALDQGADDYLTKPFEIDELLARLRALARRGPRILAINAGPLHIDLGRRNAFLREALLPLTEREFDLLAHLCRHAGQVVTKAELLGSVWEAEEIVPNVVEVHLSRLRQKLGEDAGLIETIRKAGYRLRADDTTARGV